LDDVELYRSPASYDRWYPSGAHLDEAFWPSLCQHLGAQRVLELGAGTGRLTIPLARAGLEVVGLDLSPTMLAAARDKLSDEPAEVRGRVRLVTGDMREFALDERFDLAFVPFNTFSHLHAIEEQVACLLAARQHLVPGGRVAIDISLPMLGYLQTAIDGPLATRLEGISMDPNTGVRVIWSRETRYVRGTQTILETLVDEVVLAPDERLLQRQELILHAFFPREMELLFRLAGLQVEATWGDYDFTPVQGHSLSLITVSSPFHPTGGS
jgi:SAM-dependent methyltransferase